MLKLLILPVLCMGFSVAHATQTPMLNVQSPIFNMSILDILHKTYDQYKNDFVNYLPKDIPVDRYKQVLRIEQERLKNEQGS